MIDSTTTITCNLFTFVKVETPLKTAKKLIILSGDNYDTYYSLLHYVSAVLFVDRQISLNYCVELISNA